MKTAAKIITAIAIALAITAVSKNSARAQEFDFNRAYQDYLFSQNSYNQSYKNYQASRDFYLTNQTLTLKEDARKKTLAMLKDRDTLEAVYLTALRIKIVETKGLTDDEKGGIFAKIDPEVKWYRDHSADYQDGDPLEMLFSKSAQSEERYKTTTLPIIYESLFDISLGAELGFRKDQEAIYANLKDMINSGVASGKVDLNPFNRWFTDIESLINTLKQNEETSKTQIQKMYGQYFSLQGSYNSATITLSSSLSSLKQFNNFLFEVLTSYKNQL